MKGLMQGVANSVSCLLSPVFFFDYSNQIILPAPSVNVAISPSWAAR